jgi:DNA-binding transcriptional MerR regulator
MVTRSYRVHEFAELAGVTVKALRHYDRLGLLRPERSDSGYRLYRRSDLTRLEQIIALKAIGLPLKHIRRLLARDPLPLRTTFRLQREVLEDKRRLLDRAIQALTEADEALARDPSSTTAALQKVISAMDSHDIDVMRRYYTDEAWDAWKHHYEDWPPEQWRRLYGDITAAIDSDPRGPAAQALVDRWLALTQGASPLPSVRTGLIKAWADRDHWPPVLKRRMAEFDIERATRFIGEALWERWDAEREARERAGAPGSPRVTESRRALFHDCARVLDRAPSSPEAQALVTRWRALLDAETGGDEETRREALQGFRARRAWPSGLKRYWASLHEMDAETWERVTDFIDLAAASASPPML